MGILTWIKEKIIKRENRKYIKSLYDDETWVADVYREIIQLRQEIVNGMTNANLHTIGIKPYYIIDTSHMYDSMLINFLRYCDLAYNKNNINSNDTLFDWYLMRQYSSNNMFIVSVKSEVNSLFDYMIDMIYKNLEYQLYTVGLNLADVRKEMIYKMK